VVLSHGTPFGLGGEGPGAGLYNEKPPGRATFDAKRAAKLSDLEKMINDKKIAFEKDAIHALPYSGSYGDYYRELFFHTPFSIAAQLNSQGRYEDAKHWYEKILNPTAPPPPNDSNPRHRVWQFLEFHDELVPTLKAILSDEAAIDLYEHDPFNPHAIARLRPMMP
jgi:hypothetical protein